MALNIGSQGGSYDPFIKWNSKAGRFYMKGANQGEEIEVLPGSFVADLPNIKTGWITFVTGQAPVRVWDLNLTTPAAQPSPDAKRGFSLRLFSKNTFGGIAELSSNSMHICASINDLYTVYESQAAANANKVPVVKFTGSTTMKDAKGMNYKPNFVIEKWIDRPAELDAAPVQQAAPQPQGSQAPAQPAPAPVASVSEF